MTTSEILTNLSYSKFRSSFYLTKKEREYLEAKGMDVMRRHAEDFVRGRLAAAEPINDGKQTPMHGHPVFKAMHATACCCRSCMEKWHKIPKHRELTEDEIKWTVELLIAWLEK